MKYASGICGIENLTFDGVEWEVPEAEEPFDATNAPDSEFADQHSRPIRIGVSCGLGVVPAWKYQADAWYVQVSYAYDALRSWRSGIDFDGAIYAGVMALPSASMARKVTTEVPQLAVPDESSNDSTPTQLQASI